MNKFEFRKADIFPLPWKYAIAAAIGEEALQTSAPNQLYAKWQDTTLNQNGFHL